MFSDNVPVVLVYSIFLEHLNTVKLDILDKIEYFPKIPCFDDCPTYLQFQVVYRVERFCEVGHCDDQWKWAFLKYSLGKKATGTDTKGGYFLADTTKLPHQDFLWEIKLCKNFRIVNLDAQITTVVATFLRRNSLNNSFW